MADYTFGAADKANLTEQIEGTIPASANDTRYSMSVDNNWATSKSGDGTLSTAIGTSYAGAYLAYGSSYRAIRGHILFETPENIVRLDKVPQLSLNISVLSSYVAPAVICSNALTPSTPLSSLSDEQLFKNTQTAASALYNANTGVATYNQYNTFNLNKLAAYHCITQRYIIISLINKTYDYDNTAPTGSLDSNTTILGWQGGGSLTPPKLILRSPWFKNSSTGQVQQYDGDFVINAHNPDLNQFNKRVPQTPFGLNVKGPISLHGAGSAYKITKSK